MSPPPDPRQRPRFWRGHIYGSLAHREVTGDCMDGTCWKSTLQQLLEILLLRWWGDAAVHCVMGLSARELTGDAGATCQRSHSCSKNLWGRTRWGQRSSPPGPFIDSLALCQLAKEKYLKINSSIVVQAIKNLFGTEGR